jgi:hypothetical protein
MGQVSGGAPPTRIVTHEMAREAYFKLHNAVYNHANVPLLTIPPDPTRDVDVILCDYIKQQEGQAATPAPPQDATVSVEDWHKLCFAICEDYAEIDEEWADADMSHMDEFDPWNALRKISARLAQEASCAKGEVDGLIRQK